MRAHHVQGSGRVDQAMPGFAHGKRWFEARFGPINVAADGSPVTASVPIPSIIPVDATLLRSFLGIQAWAGPISDATMLSGPIQHTFAGFTWFPIDETSDTTWSPGSGGEAIWAEMIEWVYLPDPTSTNWVPVSSPSPAVRESRSQRVLFNPPVTQLSMVCQAEGPGDYPAPGNIQFTPVTFYGWWRYLMDCH